MSDIFISYAREDLSRVRPLADALSAHGWSVWWDRHIRAGRTFDQVIAEALDNARCVMVVWSRHSVASNWVREEADVGQKRGVLIPVLIDEVSPPLGFGRVQAAPLIEWDGAPESEAFQKLAADVTAVIGTPSVPETTAPKPPERATRPSVHGRMVSLPWAGALVVVLLMIAIAVYLKGGSGGDPTQSPSNRPPPETGAGVLRLAAVLADGGEPLERGVAYEVYTAARDAAGNRKRVTGSGEHAGPPWFSLPAGRYFVTAAYGSAVVANAEVEVTPAGVTQNLNLHAGILRLTAVQAEGAEPLARGVAYEVYAAAPDAEGNRKRVTGTSENAGPPRFQLPAGRYFVTAAYGSAVVANAEAEVTPAGVTEQSLNLHAGILRLTAVLAVGGEPIPRGVDYTVQTAARDAEGNRKRVTGSSANAGPPRFQLPAGRYFVTAAYGSAAGSSEVEITPAGVTQQTLNLQAGILRLTAVLADGGEPLARGVTYTVYAAAPDAEGNRKRITGSAEHDGPPRFPLPAGRYFVSASHRDGNASAETTIRPDATQDVQLRLMPVTKR